MKILIGKYEPYQKVTSTITKTSAPASTSSRKVLQGKYQPKPLDYSASKSQILSTAKQAEGRTTAGDLKSAAAGILSSSEPIVRPSQKVDVSVFDPKEYIGMTDEERVDAIADMRSEVKAAVTEWAIREYGNAR